MGAQTASPHSKKSTSWKFTVTTSTSANIIKIRHTTAPATIPAVNTISTVTKIARVITIATVTTIATAVGQSVGVSRNFDSEGWAADLLLRQARQILHRLYMSTIARLWLVDIIRCTGFSRSNPSEQGGATFCDVEN